MPIVVIARPERSRLTARAAAGPATAGCARWSAPEPCAATGPSSTRPALGLTFEALAFVTMRQADRPTVAAFEAALAEIPQVIQAQRLFGDPDYLLRIVHADLPAFQRLYDERLATLPGVQRISSTLVMKEVVPERGLPL